MQTVFYVLAGIAAVTIIIAVPVLTIRALLLMARLEDTRKDLAQLVAEGRLSLQHANRVLAHTQESMDRVRHMTERVERVFALMQPAAAVGSVLAGAKRVFERRGSADTPETGTTEGEVR
jgi:DNA-binding transcriptional LysR family regulator